MKKIFISSDHAGFKLKEDIKISLKRKKLKFQDLGPKNDKRVDYETGIKLKMILIYFVILIISLLGLIFILDTFKYNISNVFPSILPLFDSLYETLLDLKLFFKDLTN